ncbi:MAG: ANTAR domain-containing protein [Methylococcales bacterium]
MNMINVLLIEGDFDNTTLENILKDQEFQAHKIVYPTEFLGLVKALKPDILMINIAFPTEKLLADLFLLSQQAAVPVVMFTQDEQQDTIDRVMQANVAAYVVGGFVPNSLSAIIRVARARFKQQQILIKALEEASVKLEDRKQIDRAKAILIKTQNFSEDEAYHSLRKLAMARKITLGEMAKNVIAMADLLK